ncbi:peptide/nickel transport system substrate-binding protein [Deinococcus sp. HSC-46F16]|uniref:ABC transporter substrate-binding protein n=1 Tax=Deinococcus sp. HSC-46F16 TaxID=2910968 RepID=UPI00209DF865|nr:ABC transporter substrate-binding protein [Deinococcus sp. HSC-46F16]MCP2013793.1 peptide/nickel transport system substrate-binding protein [Deinococcus sp. HSC-46F16]
MTKADSRFRRPLGLIALTTLALTLAACDDNTETNTSTESGTTATTEGSGTEGSGETASTGTGSTSSGGSRDVLVVQESADIPTLDPGTSYDTGSGQVVENLYETLVTYQGNSLTELEPLLATEWNVANEGTEYRFTLRDGVQFHTGNEFKCADAEYTFRRNLVTNTSDSGNWFLSESLLGTGANANDDDSITWEKISAAVRCDGETLVFTLPKADPAFLSKLAYAGQSIVDSEHAKEIGEWDGTEATWKDAVGKDLTGSPLSQQPSGTGAYKFVSKDATAFRAEAFENYWGEKPSIQNILIQIVPEQAARLQAFLRGDADMVETGGRAIIEEQLRGKPGVAVLDNLADTSAFGIFMNQDIKGEGRLGSGKLDGQGIPANFFSDVNVRKGFVSAFDVDTYIKEVQNGVGEPRNFLLPETFPGYNPDVEPAQFDLDAAREAFEQAWDGQVWENGFVVNATYRAGSVSAQTGMELLKKNIESLNPKFKVNLEAKQWSEILEAGDKGEEILIITGWAPDYADPDNFVHTFYSSEGYYNPRANFKDEQIDAWVNEARTTTDAERRNELYTQIAERAKEQAYFILMPSTPGILAYRDNIQGISEENYNPMLSFARAGTYWKNLSKN